MQKYSSIQFQNVTTLLTSEEFQSIGLVKSSWGNSKIKYGTGVLITDRILLTLKTNVLDQQLNFSTQIQFTPNQLTIQESKINSSLKKYLHNKTYKIYWDQKATKKNYPYFLQTQFAMIMLDEIVNIETLITLTSGVKFNCQNFRIVAIGYSQSNHDQVYFQRKERQTFICNIQQNKIVNSEEVQNGEQGSPIFAIDKNYKIIIGLLTRGSTSCLYFSNEIIKKIKQISVQINKDENIFIYPIHRTNKYQPKFYYNENQKQEVSLEQTLFYYSQESYEIQKTQQQRNKGHSQQFK